LRDSGRLRLHQPDYYLVPSVDPPRRGYVNQYGPGAGLSAVEQQQSPATEAASAAPETAQGPAFFKDQQRGWFWYEKAPEPKKKPKVEPPKVVQKPVPSYTDRLTAFRAYQEEVKARAIIDPTPENIAIYLETNRFSMEQATRFADVWQRVLVDRPDLDNRVESPTSSAGVRAYRLEERAEQDAALKAFSKQSGLFFFYTGANCPLCIAQAQVLDSMQRLHGDKTQVLGISLDGLKYNDVSFRNVDDNGTATAFQVRSVPAVFAVDPTTMEFRPITYAVMGMDEIRERMARLMRPEPDVTPLGPVEQILAGDFSPAEALLGGPQALQEKMASSLSSPSLPVPAATSPGAAAPR